MTQVSLPAAPSRRPNQVAAGTTARWYCGTPFFRSPILLGGPLILNVNGRGRLEKERKAESKTKSNVFL